MKKFLIVLFCLLASVSFASGPMSVQTDQNNGVVPMATYSYSIASNTVLDLNDVFEYDNIGNNFIKGFKFRVYGGDVVLGPLDDVATGTQSYIGEYVASGTIYPGWTGIKKSSVSDLNFVIAPCGNTVTVVFLAW